MSDSDAEDPDGEHRIAILARFLGPDRFNKFVRAVRGQCRERNRLLFWQEEALGELHARTGIVFPTSFDEIQTLFEHVEEVALPLTREVFLRDPVKAWNASRAAVDPEWLRAALNEPRFFRFTCDSLARAVSKAGQFHLKLEGMEHLPSMLSDEKVVELFAFIRDESGRIEDEWREGFEEAFAGRSPKLPPPRR